jgi:hypothetical protein
VPALGLQGQNRIRGPRIVVDDSLGSASERQGLHQRFRDEGELFSDENLALLCKN